MKITALYLSFALAALTCIQVLEATFKDDCLEAHNKLRALHRNTYNVAWSDSLAQGAQAYANEIKALGTLQHSTGGSYGENLYWSSASSASCTAAVLSWYEEIDYYSYDTVSSTNGNAIGHFTQVVWKSSNQIGVGIASGPSGTYVVARYLPRGNYVVMQPSETFNTARKRIYTAEVQKKFTDSNGNPVATPTLYQLNPSLCADQLSNCELYRSFYTCGHSYVKRMCPSLCKVC